MCRPYGATFGFGHTAALYPAIAWSYRLTISDLGGRGPFCPEELQGKNYHYDGYSTARNVYFHGRPEQFTQP
jgi:hypothetical protein